MKLKKFIKKSVKKVLLEALAGDVDYIVQMARVDAREAIAKLPPDPPPKKPTSKPPTNPAIEDAAKAKLVRLDPTAEKVIDKSQDVKLKLYRERDELAVKRIEKLEADYQKVIKTGTEQEMKTAREKMQKEKEEIVKALKAWKDYLGIE
ncbi:MAG: hypothetical protein EBU90_26010 [Proteobacteria bacterium]|nr:hypothetical protein [Pseudomonadota bacterium]